MGHKDLIALPVIGPVIKVGVQYLDAHVGALKATFRPEKGSRGHFLCQWAGKSLAVFSPIAGIGILAWVAQEYGLEALLAGVLGSGFVFWLFLVVVGCWGGSCDDTDEPL